MRIRMISLEDGITACGFRKMAAYVHRLNADTEAIYVSTNRWSTISSAIKGTIGDAPEMGPDEVDEIAQGLKDVDVVGFSSMTGYAGLTHQLSSRLREVSPDTFQVWGGIHPIIHPQDAITAPVDAICTGEGEFAFHELYDHLLAGTDHRKTKNFWFKDDPSSGEHKANMFLPLQTSEEMEALPFPMHGSTQERIYRGGEGLVPLERDDYLASDGLGYTAIWSIGCPFHCTYCGNTAFIANDKKYKKIRHPSAEYIVEEIRQARERFPHLSHVSFLDDSFMAIPYKELEHFAERWKADLDIPFAVYGVIPNYVKRDKFEILTWAGMNRVRMGIQSGSQRILDFYQRPSPPAKILAAGEIAASFAPDHHIPPVYDIIMDNPIETRQDVVETLELLYEMTRPYSLLVYSLKVIPNTELAKSMEREGIDLEEINSSYLWIPPRWANLMLYLIALVRPPRWLWERMLRRVRASHEEQKLYPRLGIVLRTLYLSKRALTHLRFMDFSITPGKTGYYAWRLGLVGLWRKHFWKRMDRPPPKPPRRVVPVTVIAPEAPEADAA